MQSSSSPFLVNIVPLANVNTTSSGINPVTSLSKSVKNMQTMVNFDKKAIFTNYLGAYPGFSNIQVTSPLVLSNVGITSNGVSIGGSAYGSNIDANSITANTITVEETCYARNFVTLSDKRVKENVSAIHGISFDTLNSIQAYKYRYVGSPQSENHIGVMAQELETLFPECVIENQGTKYVNYSALTVILLQAVKDLNARVKVLENRTVREDV
jgi:hypothetical protein